MSLKREIETWVLALGHYDRQEYGPALDAFNQLRDTSKILFNRGVIYATLGEHVKAVSTGPVLREPDRVLTLLFQIECYQHAVQLDQYLAIAYFQQGVSNFLCGDFEEALVNFNDTLLYLRGNRYIDYEQLGLDFKLHSCEVLFNRGLCYMYTEQPGVGTQDFFFASKEKAVPDHGVIDEAIKDSAAGYTVFSIPVGLVYRPHPAKVKNLGTKDYLGHAKLVAQHDQGKHRRQFSASDLFPTENHDGSYAAMHLVKPGLSSRTSIQSKPSVPRPALPPTPPSEQEPASLIESRVDRMGLVAEKAVVGPQSRRTWSDSRSRRIGLRLDTTVSASTLQASPEQESARRSISATQNNPSSSAQDRSRRESARWPPSMRQSPESTHNTAASINTTPASKRPTTLSASTVPPDASPCSTTASSTSPASALAFDLVKPHAAGFIHGRAERTLFERRAESRSRARQSRAKSHSSISARPQPPPKDHAAPVSGFKQRCDAQQDAAPSLAMRRVKIKVHTTQDTRMLVISSELAFAEALGLIEKKLGMSPGDVRLKVLDEDGDLVLVGDDEDWASVMDGARPGWDQVKDKSDTGRVEVWVAGRGGL